MKSIIALIRENRALSLAFLAVFLFCVGIYLYTRWDTARFEETQLAKPKQADSPAQPIPDETAQGGHSHYDEGLKSKAKPWIPEPPPDDPFFATIVFPDTPPSTQHGPNHSPFPVPEVIRNNPHLFEVDEYGHWNVIHLEEHMQKLRKFRGVLTDAAYEAKMAEVLAEGLPPSQPLCT